MIQIDTNDERDQTQAPPPGPPANDAPPAPAGNTGENAGGDPPTNDDGDSNVPAESLEQGSEASTYVDNPDKPDPSTVAQIEKLPGE